MKRREVMRGEEREERKPGEEHEHVPPTAKVEAPDAHQQQIRDDEIDEAPDDVGGR